MKRSLTALLAVVLTLSLAACAEKKLEPTAEAFTPRIGHTTDSDAGDRRLHGQF